MSFSQIGLIVPRLFNYFILIYKITYQVHENYFLSTNKLSHLSRIFIYILSICSVCANTLYYKRETRNFILIT